MAMLRYPSEPSSSLLNYDSHLYNNYPSCAQSVQLQSNRYVSDAVYEQITTLGRRSVRDWEISNAAADGDGQFYKMQKTEGYSYWEKGVDSKDFQFSACMGDACVSKNYNNTFSTTATLPPLVQDVAFNYPAILAQLVIQQQQKLVDQRNSYTCFTENVDAALPWAADLKPGVEIKTSTLENPMCAVQGEKTRRVEEQNKLIASKKLSLVLDLDHTLLNSAKFSEVAPNHEDILRHKLKRDQDRPDRLLFCLRQLKMWTKLRPGIWSFLEKASKLYELHICTMGDKVYAAEIAKVLDPTGVLFGGRVISKHEVGKTAKVKDFKGVLGTESVAVIMDDSTSVWPENKSNLINVDKYTYFPCSRQQLGLNGASLLERERDESREEGSLASLLKVLERVHNQFFSYSSPPTADVRDFLSSEKHKVLSGCCILFSGIFPIGECKPEQNPLWQTAEAFGAVCTTEMSNSVTHVVAKLPGTDKVKWALSTGRFVVQPRWVETSAFLYKRAKESEFALKKSCSS